MKIALGIGGSNGVHLIDKVLLYVVSSMLNLQKNKQQRPSMMLHPCQKLCICYIPESSYFVNISNKLEHRFDVLQQWLDKL